MDVRSAQCGEEHGVGTGLEQHGGGVERDGDGLAERCTTQQDLDRTVRRSDQRPHGVDALSGDTGDIAIGVGGGGECTEEIAGLARAGLQRCLRERGDPRGAWRDLEQGDAIVLRRMTQTEEEHRELLLRIGTEQEHGAARGAEFVDGGAGQTQCRFGRKTIGELGVDVVGAEHALGELGPGVGVLVGESGAADEGDRSGRCGRQRRGGGGQRLGPAGGREAGSGAQQRLAQATLSSHGLAREATLVAEPAPVHGVDVDTRVALDLIPGGVDRDATAHRTALTGGLGGVEIPGTGLEPIGAGGEGTHGTDLHGVAAEVRGERFVGERVDLGVVAPMDEVDQRIAGDVLGETRAAIAQDAALTIEQHEIADRDRLLLVALLLDHAALTGTERHGLVLEGAFAALVADRAVERMVQQQELEDAVLSLLGDLGFGLDLHAGRALDHAAGLQGRATTGVDLDEAHPAHADGLHALVVAEARDVGAGALGGVDEELALPGDDLMAVDLDDDAVDRGSLGLRHGSPPWGMPRAPRYGSALPG